MLGHLHDAFLAVVVNFKRILDKGKVTVFKQYVNNRSHNLYDSSFIHNVSHFPYSNYFCCALAPAHTSVISCVIAA